MKHFQFHLAQLRHLYQQMASGNISTTQNGIAAAAHGLLEPSIRYLEEVIDPIITDRIFEQALEDPTNSLIGFKACWKQGPILHRPTLGHCRKPIGHKDSCAFY